jgi:hypothetical protein
MFINLKIEGLLMLQNQSHRNYFMVRDAGYHDTLLRIADSKLQALVQKFLAKKDLPKHSRIVSYQRIYNYIQKLVPYRDDSYQYVALFSILCLAFADGDFMFSSNCDSECLTSFNSEPIYRDLFWQSFLDVLTLKNIDVTLEYLGESKVKKIYMDALKACLEFGLIDVCKDKDLQSIDCVKERTCFLLDHPLINRHLWNYRTSLDSKKHFYNSEKPFSTHLNKAYNDHFKLILHITKELYTFFNVPFIEDDFNADFQKTFLKLNATSGAFPLHKMLETQIGIVSYLDDDETTISTGLYEQQNIIKDSENFDVKYARGPIHHLGDSLGWILASMSYKSNIILGHASDEHFFYKISNILDEEGYQDNSLIYAPHVWKPLPKQEYKFILDKNDSSEFSESVFINDKKEGHFAFSNVLMHGYASNPIFQKFANRKIDVFTSKALAEKLFDLATKDEQSTPFFIKSIYGKFVIDAVGCFDFMKNTTYAVKESKNGISFNDIYNDYRNHENSNEYAWDTYYTTKVKNKIKKHLYEQFMAKTISSDFKESLYYLNYLYHSKKPQWIISDIVDMQDEYRIFIVNHRVVAGTPCHRRSTPLDMYPIGRFHPGLSFSHRSKFIRMNPKTRNKVAKYIRFARRFVKEMKAYGFKHCDYHIANHGNYVLDVAWSKSKNSVIPIEINEGGTNNPGNTGMYATNTIKLMGAYLQKKYDSTKSIDFVDFLIKFSFKNVVFKHKSITSSEYNLTYLNYWENIERFSYTFKKEKESYISKENYPLILKSKIKTGKINKHGKAISIKNPFLKHR